jgi:hypothetical protein
MYCYLSKNNHTTHHGVVHTRSFQRAFGNPHTTYKIARNIDIWQRQRIVQITKGKGGEVSERSITNIRNLRTTQKFKRKEKMLQSCPGIRMNIQRFPLSNWLPIFSLNDGFCPNLPPIDPLNPASAKHR